MQIMISNVIMRKSQAYHRAADHYLHIFLCFCPDQDYSFSFFLSMPFTLSYQALITEREKRSKRQQALG